MFLNDHRFVKFYVLTKPEVDALLRKFNIESVKKEEVKSFYNGYVNLGDIRLFSMWSILKYLKSGKMENYWEESGIVHSFNNAINASLIRYFIEKLCLRKSL